MKIKLNQNEVDSWEDVKRLRDEDLRWVYSYKIFTMWLPHTMEPKFSKHLTHEVWMKTALHAADQLLRRRGGRDITVVIEEAILGEEQVSAQKMMPPMKTTV